jgi:hypothetical protein
MSRRRADRPWKRGPLTREQRRLLSRPRAAREARERKAELPFERARERVRQVGLPGGCVRILDALAERHHDLGAGCRDRQVYIGYGNRGDARREQARPYQGEQPALPALAEAIGMTRRHAIRCVSRLVSEGLLRRQLGGPPRREQHEVLQRRNAAGERRPVLQGRGGAGYANGYWVEGIPPPDPPPAEALPPELPPAPSPEAPAGGRRPLASWIGLRPGARSSGSARGP